jgi:predicted transcriptional regulator
MKSSFIKKYRQNISQDSDGIIEAIKYAFELTNIYGIVKITRAISEAAVKFDLNEDYLRDMINNDSFITKNIEDLTKGK